MSHRSSWPNTVKQLKSWRRLIGCFIHVETKGKCAVSNGQWLSVLSSNNIKHLKYTNTYQTAWTSHTALYCKFNYIGSEDYGMQFILHVQFHESFCFVKQSCFTSLTAISSDCKSYTHDMTMTIIPLGVLFSVQDLLALPPTLRST